MNLIVDRVVLLVSYLNLEISVRCNFGQFDQDRAIGQVKNRLCIYMIQRGCDHGVGAFGWKFRCVKQSISAACVPGRRFHVNRMMVDRKIIEIRITWPLRNSWRNRCDFGRFISGICYGFGLLVTPERDEAHGNRYKRRNSLHFLFRTYGRFKIGAEKEHRLTDISTEQAKTEATNAVGMQRYLMISRLGPTSAMACNDRLKLQPEADDRGSDESCSYNVASSSAERSAMPSDSGVRKASAL